MRTRTSFSVSVNPAARPSFAGGRESRPARRQGFTLLELLVVMGIGTLIAALTLSGFAQLGSSQRRTTCQTNMTQIYNALRLYQADYARFPLFDHTAATPPEQGIGLWGLYTFPDYDNTNRLVGASDAPLAGYMKSSNTLHCPADKADGRTSLTDATGQVFNLDFLSYQTEDPSSGQWTYLSTRVTNKANTDWKRQLEPKDGANFVRRPPSDDTIVTWCPWHRSESGGRDSDNVLFYDGSVQLIAREQAESGDATDWRRTRRPPL